MVSFKSLGYLGFLILICSQWLQIFSADDQPNQPSKIPEADVSKPAFGSWTLPTPKPEARRGHREGGRHNGECTCNCNCDCEKTQCKDEGRNKGSEPVVCMPMECDRSGCKFRGDMNIEASNNFQYPYFMMNGEGPMGHTKSSGSMNTTEAGHQ